MRKEVNDNGLYDDSQRFSVDNFQTEVKAEWN